MEQDHLLKHRSVKDEDREKDGLKATTGSKTFLTPVIWCILVTETAERFAYFGFRAVLVLYFTLELGYTENEAIALYGYNSSLSFFTPMLGACLADGYLGRYRTILSFVSIYVVGLAVLATSAAAFKTGGSSDDDLQWKRFASFVGLFLVCLGTGGIKPCVSAFGADQVTLTASHRDNNNNERSLQKNSRYTHDDNYDDMPQGTASVGDEGQRSELIRAFFNYFYFCINIGAVTSIAIVPLFRSRLGFGWAFGVPCLFMITALFIFLSKRHEYVHKQQPVNSGADSMLMTFRITWWLILQELYSHSWIAEHCQCFKPGPAPIPTADRHHSEGNDLVDDNNNNQDSTATTWKQQMDDAAQALHALPVLAMFPIFWCLYDQQGSVWTLQATRMGLPTGIQPEHLNIVNPIQIMIFIPLFDQVIYPFLERRRWNISPLRRMSWGMLLAAAAFFMSGLVESAIHHSEQHGLPKVHVFWQLPQITCLTVGEILLSVTGLEFAYATAPDRLKAFVTALFLSTSGVGDCLSGILYSTIFAHMNRAVVMHICGALMLSNLRLFLWVARWYESHQLQEVLKQDEEEGEPKTLSTVVEGGMDLRKLRGEVA